MRFAIAALCVLALTGSAEAGETCHGHSMPPEWARQKPSVPYQIRRTSLDDLQAKCPHPNSPMGADWQIWGCVYTTGKGGKFILIADTLGPTDFACMLIYEKSHMPPNNWGDPNIEAPETMRSLGG